MELFQSLNDEGVTVIMITHDPEIAGFAKRKILIRDGEISTDPHITATEVTKP